MTRTWVDQLLGLGILAVIGLPIIPNVAAHLQIRTITATVRNVGTTPATVRILNLRDETLVMTVTVPARSRSTVSFPERDVWSEPGSSYGDHGAVLQVLAGGCEMVDQIVLAEPNGMEVAWVGLDPLAGSSGPMEQYPTVEPAVVPDPCAGSKPPASGVVLNQTTTPIAIAPGVVVPACGRQTIRPGDLPAGGFDANAVVPEGAIRVDVPSIAVQDERWPMELRRVLVTSSTVTETAIRRHDGIGGLDPVPCAGSAAGARPAP